MPDNILAWRAPEFEKRTKNASWYWISIIAAACAVSFAAWQKNLLFGLFVVIAEILILAWANQNPRIFEFALTGNELRIGKNIIHPYGELESFSIIKTGGDFEEIILRPKKHLRRPFKIKIPKPLIENARGILGNYIPETEFEPSLLDSIEEFIGF